MADPEANSEQLETAYGKLIAIYAAREDYKTINDLLQSCGNVNIMSKYQSYMAMEPEFNLQEGYYTSIQPLKLTTFGSGKFIIPWTEANPERTVPCIPHLFCWKMGIIVLKQYTSMRTELKVRW